MAVFSLIRKSQIGGSQRLDAEYYQPKYLQLDTILTRRSVPLRKIATIKGGKRLPIGETFVEEGVPYVRVTDIQNFYIDFTSVAKITEELHLRLNRYQISYEEIAIAIVGNTIGLVGFMLEQIAPCNLTENCARIISNSLSPYYLSIFLSCKYGQLQVKRLTVGTAQPKFGLDKIAILQVYIPSKSFELIIEGLNREAYKRFSKSFSLYHQAEQLLLSELGLLDWKPARPLTFVGSYRDAARAQRTDAEHFHPKYAELRACIRSYANGYLKITDIAKNSDETIEPRAEPEKDFNYVELADINQVIGTIESANTIKGKDAPSRARMLLRTGDVIASTVEGSLDKVALVSEEHDGAIGSTGFFVLRPRSVPSGYLLALAKSILVREQMRCESSGTILAAVPGRSLQNIIVPNLPPDKRDEIARLVQQSHTARREAKALLEKAKRAVEIAIEEGEERAIEFIG